MLPWEGEGHVAVHYEQEKFTTMSFMGYLSKANPPPLNLGGMLRLTLNHSYHSFDA